MNKASTLSAITIFFSVLLGWLIIANTTINFFDAHHDKQFENIKESTMSTSSQAIRLPLWNYDNVYIEQILDSILFKSFEDVVVAISLENNKNKELSYRSVDRFKEHTFSSLSSLSYIETLSRNIEFKGRTLGRIRIAFSKEPLLKELSEFSSKFLIFGVMMAIVLSFFITYIMRSLLTKPLAEIANEASQIHLDFFNVKLKRYKLKELNELSASFNKAMKEISQRGVELGQQNIHLEKLVEERTSELDKQRMNNFEGSRLASLGQMAAGVAHEVNNPLTIIRSHSQKLSNELEEFNQPKLQERAQKIVKTVDRISSIIHGMRAFSRDGRADNKKNFPIEPFVLNLKSLCENMVKSKDIFFDVQFEKGIQIFGNETQLGQILINLINNSIDALEHVEEKWITISFSQAEKLTSIRIKDSGRGIPEVVRKKIMEPFYTTKEINKGTGLGLSISFGIIQAHDGHFYVDGDDPNTLFVIELPRVIV